MSLISALDSGLSALGAAQTAIQVAGQNIANAADPDYARQRTVMVSRLPVPSGDLIVGTGVEVARIERVINRQLDQILRESRSRFGSLSSTYQTMKRLEGIFNELDGIGLSTALSRFFDSAENLATQPDDMTARRLFLAAAESLAQTFQTQDQQMVDLRRDLNSQVQVAVQTINRLTGDIARLNQEILLAEKGGQIVGAANDLRNRRDALVNELAELIDIDAHETSRGVVNVSVGSDFLVENSTASQLYLDPNGESDILIEDIRIERSNKLVRPRGGRLQGILEARDTIIPQFSSELDELARGLLFEVNKVHSSGRGLVGRSEVTSRETLDAFDTALNASATGLEFTPRTGSFDLKIANSLSGLEKTFNIRIDLDGLNNDDTTAQSLVTAINTAVAADFPGVQASLTSDGRLRIASANGPVTFTFANDTSDALASLGIGTLFTGSDARDIDVAEDLVNDPELVATGLGDGPNDSRSIQALSDLRSTKILQNGNTTIEDFYLGTVGVLGVQTAEITELLSSQEAINEQLKNERASISGVNLDEEATDLIRYQRVYQGAARYISVVDRMLESLVNLI